MGENRIDIWHEMQERRVLQLVGLYFGASWVALEFTGFLSDRYTLSPNIIDLILLTMLTMLPSVIVMAWTHGKPGKDDWTRAEKVVVPVNVIATFALMFYFFGGKELGAATEMVSIENASGERIERAVPKSVFRKRVALFYLSNDTENEANDWVGRWIAYGMHVDLMQDIYFDSQGPFQLAPSLIDAGAPEGHAPLALMRQIASRLHKSYFLTGSVTSAEPYSIEITLYKTKGGQVVANRTYDGDNIGQIIDRAAVDLKHDVELTDAQISEASDLPIEALSSDDPKALQQFTAGMQQLYFHSDYPGALQLLAKSARTDQTFAQAQFNLYKASLLMGQDNAASISKAMQYIYKIPERLQGEIKEVYYLWQGDPDQALSALQLDATLFPDDVVAHRRLANFYVKVGTYGDALEEYQIVKSLNPDDDLVLRDMAEAYAAMGKFRMALEKLQQFARSNPRDGDVLVETGEIYQLMGETGRAAKIYARASLLGANSAKIKTNQGRVLFQEGRYEDGIAIALEAVEEAQSPDVKFGALMLLEQMYGALGRVNDGMAIARRNMSVGREAFGPMNSIILRMSHFSIYTETTLADSVLDMLKQFDLSVPAPWDQAIQVMLTIYKSKQENVTIPLVELGIVREFYSEYKYLVNYPEEEIVGGIYLNNGDYVSAIQNLIVSLSRNPKRLLVQRKIAKAYRLLGDADAAMATIEPLLRIFPHEPEVLYELYHIQLLNDPVGASATLIRLQAIWEQADEIFIPAQQILADAAALGAS